jgi:hypothetical protein
LVGTAVALMIAVGIAVALTTAVGMAVALTAAVGVAVSEIGAVVADASGVLVRVPPVVGATISVAVGGAWPVPLVGTAGVPSATPQPLSTNKMPSIKPLIHNRCFIKSPSTIPGQTVCRGYLASYREIKAL